MKGKSLMPRENELDLVEQMKIAFEDKDTTVAAEIAREILEINPSNSKALNMILVACQFPTSELKRK